MLIRVLEIANSSGKYHFGGGETCAFVEVDWFRDALEIADQMGGTDDAPTITTAKGRILLTEYLKAKRYFDPAKAYLVLAQEHTFTINYNAP